MTDSACVSERFASCTFTPVTRDDVASTSDGTWSTTSYYLDSSGRCSFLLPLQLACPTKEVLDCIVASGCLRPAAPKNVSLDEDSESSPCHTLRLEAQCHDECKTVTAEKITILSCSTNENSILLDTEVVVRSSSQQDTDPLKTRLDVTALLVHHNTATPQQRRPVASGLLALELSGGSLPLTGVQPTSVQSSHTTAGPISIHLILTQALTVSATSVGGSSRGDTMVSLTVKHSNTHSEPVTVTNIALHPGHSRQEVSSPNNRSMPGGTVTDMSKYVQWGYVPRTEPQLPITLYPYDAHSTVITIKAGDDLQSRSFCSPVSVTAVVGQDKEHCPQIVAATDAQWTTGRVAVEPTDAFRIDMSLEERECFVGDPVSVSMRVLNLSKETRDLMLIVAKNDRSHVEPVRPVLSKVGGYSFGVLGLSGDAPMKKTDHELLAVDAAQLLGEVQGQHALDAELRFVPLVEGTLKVPHFMLYDKTEGEWYNCDHKLSIVAASKK